MKGVKLQVFHCYPSELQHCFNKWVEANPGIEIVEVKLVAMPSFHKYLSGDVVLLVFYYPG